jgi:hypothetical protein
MRNGYERDGTFVRSAGTHGVDVSCGWMAGWLDGWWLVVGCIVSLFAVPDHEVDERPTSCCVT